jgi:microcystin degradation protein MlrC
VSRRVAVAQIMHETNTFSVQPGDRAAFEKMYLLSGEAYLDRVRGAAVETQGFLEVAAKEGWTVVPTVGAAANPCGKVTDAVFDWIVDKLTAPMRDGPIDGVLLALHGAMVSESHDDAEGAILEAVRRMIGPKPPIAVTFDLHANVSDRTMDLADIVISYRTYPHIDMRERGVQAAELLAATMAGRIAPRTLLARRPLLKGVDGARTDKGPTVAMMATLRAQEAEPGILAASLNAGFWHADIVDVGPTVTVVHDTKVAGAADRARAIAEAMMDEQWRLRRHVTNVFLTPAQAAAEAKAHDGVGGPLIIADFADNPGGGSYGDSTTILEAMLAASVTDAAVGTMRDAVAAAACHAAGLGATLTLAIGGKVDPKFGGGPLTLTGTVVHLSDGEYVNLGPMSAGMRKSLGACATFRVAGIDIVLASNLLQVLDRAQFLANGIDPAAKKVLLIKSMQHFRAAFEPIAARVIVADGGGLVSPDYSNITFHKARRPLFPLDEMPDRLPAA